MVVRKRTRSRKRTPMRRRRIRTRSRRPKSFKQKALDTIPTASKITDVFYETTNQAVGQVVNQPNLLVNRINALAVSPAALDARSASRIMLKGFRIRATYVNNLVRPMHMNVAIVTPKDGQLNPIDFNAGFFKRLGIGSLGNVDVGLNFDSTDLSDITMATLPMNSDRMNIIWHTRFKLGVINTTGGFSSGELKNYRTLYRYIKINKVITFPSNTSNLPDPAENFYLICWGVPITWVQTEGPIVGASDINQHVVMVFKKY